VSRASWICLIFIDNLCNLLFGETLFRWGAKMNAIHYFYKCKIPFSDHRSQAQRMALALMPCIMHLQGPELYIYEDLRCGLTPVGQSASVWSLSKDVARARQGIKSVPLCSARCNLR